jgi:hypothetical protein
VSVAFSGLPIFTSRNTGDTNAYILNGTIVMSPWTLARLSYSLALRALFDDVQHRLNRLEETVMSGFDEAERRLSLILPTGAAP